MTTWVVPEGTWQLEQANDGDVLLRQEGENLLVARVTGGNAEWLGPVPEGTLSVDLSVGAVTEPTQRPDLDAAVEPIAAALNALGG